VTFQSIAGIATKCNKTQRINAPASRGFLLQKTRLNTADNHVFSVIKGALKIQYPGANPNLLI
jgi:hypothetical protein